jgi:hypothetical protein
VIDGTVLPFCVFPALQQDIHCFLDLLSPVFLPATHRSEIAKQNFSTSSVMRWSGFIMPAASQAGVRDLPLIGGPGQGYQIFHSCWVGVAGCARQYTGEEVGEPDATCADNRAHRAAHPPTSQGGSCVVGPVAAVLLVQVLGQAGLQGAHRMCICLL